LSWAQQLSATDLAGDLNYRSMLSPGDKCIKLWIAVTHMFNHQTHHRGQLTTLLSQLGIDPGVTDLMFMPGLVTTR
jgi:uncharacterized damage-inducible protein DinB